MKGNKAFAAGFAVFLLLMFAIQMSMPQRFRWEPTFAKADKNPFGAYVFDSVMAQTMPHGYSTTRNSLYQTAFGKEPHGNVLVTTDDFRPTATDIKALKKMAGKGVKVMIAGGGGTVNSDSLIYTNTGMKFSGNIYFSLKTYKNSIKNNSLTARDTICWRQTDGMFGENSYETYSTFTDCHIEVDPEVTADTLATCRQHNLPIAVRRRIGRGEVVMVGTPLLLTNYGLLDSHTTGYVFRLMSLMADKPLTRTTAYMKTADEAEAEMSPLRVLLARPPLRTALYATLAVIVLLMVQTARRRQRVIPVVTAPPNRSLEFVQLIGTLYYQEKDHSDIVRKKYSYFCEELRQLLQTDLGDPAADALNFGVIARRTGMSPHEVATIIGDIRRVVHRETEATEYGVRLYIDQMNTIVEKIT